MAAFDAFDVDDGIEGIKPFLSFLRVFVRFGHRYCALKGGASIL